MVIVGLVARFGGGGRWGRAREGWKEVGRILYNLTNFWFRMKGLLIGFESW